MFFDSELKFKNGSGRVDVNVIFLFDLRHRTSEIQVAQVDSF